MKDTQQYPDEQQGTRPRAAYAKPSLKAFGFVGVLTQAGTGTQTELLVNGMMSNNPNRRI